VKTGRDKGMALLHAAVEWGNIYVVKWLLERGVDINSHNASNRTPLVTSDK
jgi:ankyrin repeat protein